MASEKPTDNDVELARISARFSLWRMLVPAVWIAALWFPIRAVIPIADVLAGQKTELSLAITINVAISIVLGGTVGALLIKMRGQRNEIQRLRKRAQKLEEDLETLRREKRS